MGRPDEDDIRLALLDGIDPLIDRAEASKSIFFFPLEEFSEIFLFFVAFLRCKISFSHFLASDSFPDL